MTKKKRPEITKANQYVTDLQAQNVIDSLNDTTGEDFTIPRNLNSRFKTSDKKDK